MLDLLPPSLNGIDLLRESDYDQLRASMDAWDYAVYEIDGTHATDTSSFLALAADALKMPLPASGEYSWQGFQDRLWGLLANLEQNQVALVWRHTDRMLEGGLADLLQATIVFNDLAGKVYDYTSSGFPREMTLNLIFTGDGPNFSAQQPDPV